MTILILGVGNELLSDEGVGVVAMRRLAERWAEATDLQFLDGGTLSFTLAVPIAEHPALIVIDAAMVDGAAGSVAIFEGLAMDRFLGENRKASVHEVGLLDLMHIARLTDAWPTQRALIGIRPQRVDWGDALSPPVAQALPAVESATEELIRRWRST